MSEQKKGELLNQLALISDLIENINLEPIESELIFSLNEKSFKESSEYFAKKNGEKPKNIENSFHINIGELNIVFINKNNV